MCRTPEEHVMNGQRTALLLRDVSSALVFLHRAEDDVHLLERAAFRLGNEEREHEHAPDLRAVSTSRNIGTAGRTLMVAKTRKSFQPSRCSIVSEICEITKSARRVSPCTSMSGRSALKSHCVAAAVLSP